MVKPSKFVFITLIGLIVLLSLISIVSYSYESKQLIERNNYGELLLGLNANPRPPTSDDIIKGYVQGKSGNVYVIFESREFKYGDMGLTSYWRIDG